MKIKRINVNDRIINMIQDNISDVVDHIATKDIIFGEVIQKVSLTTGSNTISHRLGRTLIGWFIIRQRSSASVYDLQDSNANPELFLKLQSSANVTVDLYVF